MSRVKMPHNNRVSTSAALQTNNIWSKTIGFDPYAAADEDSSRDKTVPQEQAAGLMLLMKMSNLSGTETRGACRRCGNLGHLTFQCRNVLESAKAEHPSDTSDSESEEEICQPSETCRRRGSSRSRSRSRDKHQRETSDTISSQPHELSDEFLTRSLHGKKSKSKSSKGKKKSKKVKKHKREKDS